MVMAAAGHHHSHHNHLQDDHELLEHPSSPAASSHECGEATSVAAAAGDDRIGRRTTGRWRRQQRRRQRLAACSSSLADNNNTVLNKKKPFSSRTNARVLFSHQNQKSLAMIAFALFCAISLIIVEAATATAMTTTVVAGDSREHTNHKQQQQKPPPPPPASSSSPPGHHDVLRSAPVVARAIPLPLSPIAASGPRRELPPLLSPPPMSKIAAAREIRPAGAPQPAPAPRLQQRGAPAAHGVVQQHCTGGSGGGEGGGGCAGGDGGGLDFNPALAGGIRGSSGIKGRLNPRGFQYASALFATILNWVLKYKRLPNINQCISEFNGCINVYNLYVSRYRCAQRVVVYPAPPNQIVISVENLDIGVTGNLGGQITVLVPLALFGIVQVNVHQASVRLGVVLARAADGYAQLQVASCSIAVGYVDVYIENGGLLGDLASSQFRPMISKFVKQKILQEGCARIGPIIDAEVNPRLRKKIPQSVALTTIIEALLGALDLGSLLQGGGHCPSSCGVKASGSTILQANSTTSVVSVTGKNDTTPAAAAKNSNATTDNKPDANKDVKHKQAATSSKGGKDSAATTEFSHDQEPEHDQKGKEGKEKEEALHEATPTNGGLSPAPPHARRPELMGSSKQRRVRLAPAAEEPSRAASRGSTSALMVRDHQKSMPVLHPTRRRSPPTSSSRNNTTAAVVRARALSAGHGPPPNSVLLDPSQGDPCAYCPRQGGGDQIGALLSVLRTLDMSKLSTIYLTTQLVSAYATTVDYTLELNGEFSPQGRGGTPFGAFPMDFAQHPGHKMADVLISDFTINSLFYHLHRSGFISIRVGPDTPKLGPLLRTTCNTDDENALEDHGVETDEVVSKHRRMLVRRRRRWRQRRVRRGADRQIREHLGEIKHRSQRDTDPSAGLGDLGVCLGDIIPTIHDQYPNELVEVVAHTAGRAPSVVLSAANGGTATLELTLDADFYIQSRQLHFGTIRLALCLRFQLVSQGRHLAARASICGLHLDDVGGRLGLGQEALDNLGNLGKEILVKAGNDVLEKGFELKSPPAGGVAGLPLNIVDPEAWVVEHAVDIGFDFTITPQGLAQLGGADTC